MSAPRKRAPRKKRVKIPEALRPLARRYHDIEGRLHLRMLPERECPAHPFAWWHPIPPSRHSALAERHELRVDRHLGKKPRAKKQFDEATFYAQALAGELDG